MRKEHVQIEQVKNTKVDYVICNKCGREFKAKYNMWPGGMYDFKTHFDFESNHDMEVWEWDLCEECLLDIVKTFKYAPKGFMQVKSYPDLLDGEDPQEVFEGWKEG